MKNKSNLTTKKSNLKIQREKYFFINTAERTDLNLKVITRIN